MTDVIVVGGGASGMLAAAAAARGGSSVMILEHNRTLGKKILATGNGKCNYTNEYQSPECYRGDRPDLAWNIYRRFPAGQTVTFFKELGLMPSVRKGYYYPASGRAQSMVDILLDELHRLGVNCKTNAEVVSIDKTEKGFLVRTGDYVYEAGYCIIAAGGKAASVHGTRGAGYGFAERFGHTIRPLYPALVQIKCGFPRLSALAGLHINASAELWAEGGQKAKEQGEILFTAYGLSGIPVLQISRFAAAALGLGQYCELRLDLAADLTAEGLYAQLAERIAAIGYKAGNAFLRGWFPDKLGPVLLGRAGIKADQPAGEWTEPMCSSFVSVCKNFILPLSGTNDFEQAQTTAGGVPLSELTESLESKLVPGLFFTGEVVDVDGTCGGYNLQWAWTSGYLAGSEIAGRKDTMA